jgi:hypothetical protein
LSSPFSLMDTSRERLAQNCRGRTIWIADAHCGDGKRFVVHADEKLTAFLKRWNGQFGLPQQASN